MVRGLLLSPKKTFPELRQESMKSAFVYFLGILAIHIIFTGLSKLLFFAMLFDFVEVPHLASNLLAKAPADIITTITGGIAGAWILGGWIHLWVSLFGGRRGIGETIRVVFYASTPPCLFAWIPLFWAVTVIHETLQVPGFTPLQGSSLAWNICLIIAFEILLFTWGFLLASYGVGVFQDLPRGQADKAVVIPFLILLALALVYIYIMFSLFGIKWFPLPWGY
jgi:hypothetical protein